MRDLTSDETAAMTQRIRVAELLVVPSVVRDVFADARRLLRAHKALVTNARVAMDVAKRYARDNERIIGENLELLATNERYMRARVKVSA